MSRASTTLPAERSRDASASTRDTVMDLCDETTVALAAPPASRRAIRPTAVPHRAPQKSRSRALSDRWGDSVLVRQHGEAALEASSDGELALSIDVPATQFSLSEAGYLATKRVLDILVAAIGIIALLPLWGFVAVLQLFVDRGPLFYVHTRVGNRGREFACYKLRSMRVGSDRLKADLLNDSHHDDPRSFKIKHDPRVTPLGRFLRRSSLDETPQLLNVLLGQMSLVGPRPSLPVEVAQYTLDEMDRLDVKPGLTCIWQVSGRSNVPFPEQLEMDRDYIRRRSTLLDIKLLAATVRAVISADGAY